MSYARSALRTSSQPIAIILAFAITAIVFVLFPVRAAAQGWLLAFAVWSGFPIGAMVLLMIHRITGGEWGDAIASVLRTGAKLVGLVFLALVLVVLLQKQIYPWDNDQIDDSVTRYYLNPAAFTLRTALTACGWLVLGVVFGRGGGSPLAAGLGLAFFGISISFVSIDWFLSLDPHRVATTFGAMIGIQDLLTGIAIAAILSPGVNRKVANDLGGLLLATLLGTAYLELMTYIVQWYGDLPHKVEWYARRTVLPWQGAIIASTVLALLAFALLILHRLRSSPAGLRVSGAFILLSIGLHWVWLIGPEMQNPLEGMACAALSGIALVLLTHALAKVLEPEPVPRPTSHKITDSPEPLPPDSRPRPAIWFLLLVAFVEHLQRPHARSIEAPPSSAASDVAQTGNDTRELEPADVNAKAVAAIALCFLGFVALSAGGLGFYFHHSTRAPLFPAVQGTPSPQITFPADEAIRLRKEQIGRLENGPSRVTIEQAMAAIAARGKNAFDPVDPGVFATQAEGGGK